MNLIDVHCHLDESFYNHDVDDVVKRARDNNVTFIVTAGIDPKTNRNALKLKEKFPDIIFPSLGIYPPDALKNENPVEFGKEFNIDKEIEFIYSNRDRISAIGEIGMDFKDGTDPENQEKIFRKMVELAIKIDKPVVVHSRKAEAKVIEILESYKYQKIIMHCFGGKHSLVKRIRDNQWFFSIPTSIVRDEHFQKIVKETRIHLLLTETDSPFLSPFKEQRNEPAFIMETIKKISELRNIPEEDVANIIYKNAQKLFGF